MSGTLDPTRRAYNVSVTYTCGLSLSFGVEKLEDVIPYAVEEGRKIHSYAAYYIVVEAQSARPQVLAAKAMTLAKFLRFWED